MPGKGERTRDALLDAAVARFARDGFRAVSVADVARDVGVTPAAVYAYFPSKEALFTAAVDADAAGLIEDAVVGVLGPDVPPDWGTAMFGELMARLPEHPLARRVLSGLEPTHIERLLDIPALAELRKSVTALVADQQMEGVVRSDVDPATTALGVETIVLAMLISTLQTGVGPDSDRGQAAAAVLSAAVRPEPPRSGRRAPSPPSRPRRRAR